MTRLANNIHPYLLSLLKTLIVLKFNKKINEKLNPAERNEIAKRDSRNQQSKKTIDRMFIEERANFSKSTLDLLCEFLKPKHQYKSWDDFERREAKYFVYTVENKPFKELSNQSQLHINQCIDLRLNEFYHGESPFLSIDCYRYSLLRFAVVNAKTGELNDTVTESILLELAKALDFKNEVLHSFFYLNDACLVFHVVLLDGLVNFCSGIWAYKDWKGFTEAEIPENIVILQSKSGILGENERQTINSFALRRLQQMIAPPSDVKPSGNLFSIKYVLLLVLSVLFFVFVGKVAISRLLEERISLKIDKTNFNVGDVRSLMVNYKIPNVKPGDSWILKNYNLWDKKYNQFSFRKLEDPIGTCTFDSYFPASYNLLLYHNNRICAEIPYYIQTNSKWYEVYRVNERNDDELPSSCADEKVFIQKGILQAPKSQNAIWANFLFIKDLGIDAHNFVIEARVRNRSMPAFDTQLMVYAEKGAKIGANFISAGSQYGYIYTGDSTMRSGANHADLADFQIDLSYWRIIKIKCEQTKISFLVDNKRVGLPIYPCTMKMIHLQGIRLLFKSSGECDWVRIKDINEKTILFNEDFDRN